MNELLWENAYLASQWQSGPQFSSWEFSWTNVRPGGRKSSASWRTGIPRPSACAWRRTNPGASRSRPRSTACASGWRASRSNSAAENGTRGMAVFPRTAGKAVQWTRERVDALVTADVKQLRTNAENLSEPEIVTWCDEVLHARPKGSIAVKAKAKRGGRKLVSRSKAFELRGVFLQDPGWSRGGVRKADGMVVLTVWAGDISAAEGGCSYRLW